MVKYDCFEHKVAVISGGAGGMGVAIAKKLLEQGAHVALVDQDEQKLGDAREKMAELSTDQAKQLYIQADVRNSVEVKNAIAQVQAELKVIDILINAVGIYIGRAIDDTSDEDFDNLIGTNLKAPLYFCREVVPFMKQNNGGAIVNISSIGGAVAMEGSPAYVATKTGITGLTRSLGLDLIEYGIRVNGIAPGWTLTPMTEALYADPNIRTALLADTPANRFAMPEEQADLALWLASDHASYMCGQTILNDGGWTLR